MSDVEGRVVLVTVPDAYRGREIGRRLVEERLAACVNVLPGATSIYRWEGEVMEEPEALLVVKTTAPRLAALRERLVLLHPYDVPELLALPVEDGLPDYLEWLGASVAPEREGANES